MGKQKKIRGNQFGVSGFESLQGQTCKCSSESERGQNRDCYQSLEPVREAVTQWALGLPLLAAFCPFQIFLFSFDSYYSLHANSS